MAEANSKKDSTSVAEKPGTWKWYRLSVIDEDGKGFDADNPAADGRFPFYAHAIAGHTFAYINEGVRRNTEGETVRVQHAGAIDRLWVTGNPEDCELLAVKSRMDRYVVRWNRNGKTAQVFEKGSKVYRPEREDVPIARYLRMEEVPEPAVTALV